MYSYPTTLLPSHTSHTSHTSHPHRPSSLESLRRVEGVSEMWVERYGERMLTVVQDHCRQATIDVPMDVFPEKSAEPLEKLVEVNNKPLNIISY